MPFFSKTYNPVVDDYDAIVAAAAPHTLVGVTLFSSTAVRLDFAPTDVPSPAVKPTAVTLPPYIKPLPKRH